MPVGEHRQQPYLPTKAREGYGHAAAPAWSQTSPAQEVHSEVRQWGVRQKPALSRPHKQEPARERKEAPGYRQTRSQGW